MDHRYKVTWWLVAGAYAAAFLLILSLLIGIGLGLAYWESPKPHGSQLATIIVFYDSLAGCLIFCGVVLIRGPKWPRLLVLIPAALGLFIVASMLCGGF